MKNIYITIINYEDMTFEKISPIFNKCATLRDKQEDKWKFDFSNTTIKNGIKGGVTFCYNLESSEDFELLNFLTTKLL
jgi:hypothetical protein